MTTQQDFNFSPLFDNPTLIRGKRVVASETAPKVFTHCRGCKAQSGISIDAPAPLCRECLSHLDTVYPKVLQSINAIKAELLEEAAEFDRQLKRSSPEVQQRWDKVLESRLRYVGTPHETQLRQREQELMTSDDDRLGGLLRIERDSGRTVEALCKECADLEHTRDAIVHCLNLPKKR